MVDSIIFDVDGTLWDVTEIAVMAWKESIKKYANVDLELTNEGIQKEFGKPISEIIRDLLPGKDDDLYDYIQDKFEKRECQMVEQGENVLYPGMVETLKALSKDYKILIVSNCQSGYIPAFINNSGLKDIILDDECPGDSGLLKADNIKLVIERNGLKYPIYVGDTAGDEAACKEANVPMIHAAYGFGEVVDEHIAINDIKELLKLPLNDLFY